SVTVASRTAYVRYVNVFFFQAEDGIRDDLVTGVQTCALRSQALARRGRQRAGRRDDVAARGASERADDRTVDRRRDLHDRLRIRSEERRVGKEWRSRWTGEG